MAESPPSKKDLSTWWSGFKKKSKKDQEKVAAPSGIFGVPLATSIKYANVAISLTKETGESYTYGYVPIVIAKCGVFLKEKGTDVHGIFRLPGSAKRIKELQAIFDAPDRFGKGLNWDGYTVHDAGSIFRRYVNALPEPVIPLSHYEDYREPIRNHQKEATGDAELPADPKPATEFNHSIAIETYQKLITKLPPLNRQLLLYLLDLLAVFASKSDVNGMDSHNLSAIFQPGILSHPKHDLVPLEYKLSQNVLVYLIMNQDHFLVGMSGTEADEKTVKDVQAGPSPTPTTPPRATHAGLGRSASSASAGTDSLRRIGLRRGASSSSKQSNASGKPANNSPAPSSPLVTSSSGGVHRSNTLPSKKSPSLNSPRMSRNLGGESATPRSNSHSPGPQLETENKAGLAVSIPAESSIEKPVQPVTVLPSTPEHPTSNQAEQSEQTPTSRNGPIIPTNDQVRIRSPEPSTTTTISADTPTKERRSIFSKSPIVEHESKDSRQPNKLRKKSRQTENARNVSSQSSANSLADASEVNLQQIQPTSPKTEAQGPHAVPSLLSTEATPKRDLAPQLGDVDTVSSFHVSRNASRERSPAGIQAKSPVPSVHSGLAAEDSDVDHAGNGSAEKSSRRRSRWRLSSAVKKDQEPNRETATQSRLGSTAVPEEEGETAITGSPPQRPRKSATEDSQHTNTATESSAEKDHDGDEREHRGLFGRIRAKVHQSKEERKERAKSPSPVGDEKAKSKQSLNAIASEKLPTTAPIAEVKADDGQKLEELK